MFIGLYEVSLIRSLEIITKQHLFAICYKPTFVSINIIPAINVNFGTSFLTGAFRLIVIFWYSFRTNWLNINLLPVLSITEEKVNNERYAMRQINLETEVERIVLLSGQYVHDSCYENVVIGLSGGIDSSLPPPWQ